MFDSSAFLLIMRISLPATNAHAFFVAFDALRVTSHLHHLIQKSKSPSRHHSERQMTVVLALGSGIQTCS